MRNKVFGFVLAAITLIVAWRVFVAIVIILAALSIQDVAALTTVANISQLIGLLLGIWLAVKVWKHFTKPKTPANAL